MVMVNLRCAVLACLPLAALGGCRAIAGLHDIELATKSACSIPALPTRGDGMVRLVNAATSSATGDFCMRVSGTSDWGSPILGSGEGPTCAAGLPYLQVTVPFAAPAGEVDVKAIATGATCDATATSEKDAIAIGDAKASPVITVIRMGATGGERIVALPEEPPNGTGGSGSDLVRIVNALSADISINVGLTNTLTLPTTISSGPALGAPIAPGSVEAAGTSQLGSFDAQGYLQSVGINTIDLGVVPQGGTSALFAFATAGRPDTQSLFAVGDPNDPAHRARGVLCEDAPPARSPSAALVDAGASADAGAPSLVDVAPQLFADCTISSLPSLAIDTFNIALYGGSAPFESDRRPAIYDAIAGRASDLMCVIEASRDSDKAGIAAAAKKSFPYSYYPIPPLDLDTVPADPTLADGGEPPVPTVPPCGGSIDKSKVEAVYACVLENCAKQLQIETGS
jgi:hypothetical protein